MLALFWAFMRSLLVLLVVAGMAWGEFRAGAAKRVITPDLKIHAPVYMAGFGQNRVATAIHDDLFARCVALSDGRKPVVLCGVDVIGLFLDDVERIRAGVKMRLSEAADIVVVANHGHEGPDTMGLWGPQPGVTGLNEAYNTLVVERTAEAAAEAIRGMRGAKLKLARDNSPVLKQMIDDDRPPVLNDAELLMADIRDGRGRPIATLVNWANHPEALGSKNTLISADYLEAFYRKVETLRGGVAVFLNGAIGGMQSPLGAKIFDPLTLTAAPKDSFRFSEVIGEKLAILTVDGLNEGTEVKIDRVEYRERRIKIPVANPNFELAAKANLYRGRKAFGADRTTETVVGYLVLGDAKGPKLEAACIPGELYPELSVGGIERYPGADFPEAPLEPAAKKMMRAPYRMLFGLANDEIGYIIPKAEWDAQEPWLNNAKKRWYGEVNSVGPEAAPLILRTLQELIGN